MIVPIPKKPAEIENTRISEDVKRVHSVLVEDLRSLEEAAQPTSGEGLTALRSRLRTARGHLAEHFRFEEQNGYMDAIRKREPRLERPIQQLSEEHRQLARILDSLVGEASAAATLDHGLRAGVQVWIERVRHHEIRENKLVQDTFDLDIGAKD